MKSRREFRKRPMKKTSRRPRARRPAQARAVKDVTESVSNAPVMLFELDARGQVILLAGGLAERLGLNPKESIGRSIPEMHAGIPRAVELIKRALAGEDFRTVIHVKGHSLEMCFSPRRGGQGRLTGVTGWATDITERRQAEEALRESEDKYKAIFQGTGDGILVADAQTKRFKYANPAICAMFGYTADELLRLGVADIHPKESIGRVLEEFEAQSRGEKLLAPELPCLRKDGTVFLADIKSGPFVIGGRAHTIGLFMDVTERKRTEATLRESEERFRQAFEFSGIGMALLSPDGCWLRTNLALRKMLGYTEEELRRTTFQELTHPEDLSKNLDEARRLLAGEIPRMQAEKRYRHQDGHYVWACLNTSIVRSADGKPMYYVSQIEDISERKQAEEALHRLNRALRAISDCNQTLTRAQDEQTLLKDICRIICDEAGYRMAWVGYAEHDEAKTVRPVAWAGVESGYLANADITWADTERGRGPTGTALRSGRRVGNDDFTTDQKVAPWRDDALRRGYHSSLALPLKDDEDIIGALTIYSTLPDAFNPDEVRLLEELAGNLAFGIKVLRTRAERKRMEQQLRANLHFFESLDQVNRAIQGANDLEKMMSNVLNAVFTIFACDRAWLFYPCDPDAPSFRVPMEICKPEYPGAKMLNVDLPMPPDMAQNLREALESAEPVTYAVGTEKPVNQASAEQFGVKSQMMVAIYPKSGKPWVFGVHQCSYPRLWTPEEGKLLQEIGRRLSDGLSILLAYRDLQDSETKYRRIVDTANEGIWTLGPDTMTTFVNARMAKMLGCSREAMIGQPMTDFMFEEDVPDHLKKMENRRQGLPENYERRFRSRDGQTIWANASAVPIFDDEHHFKGSFAMFTDISERKRAEEERVRLLEAEQAARIEAEAANKAKDDFLAIVSHELRTPLTAVLGWSWLLRSGQLGEEDRQNAVDIIMRNLQAQRQIIEDLIDVSSLSRGQFTLNRATFDLSAILDSACESLGPLARSRSIRLVRDLQGPAGVMGDSGRLQQVFCNLLHNALKFTPDGGEIRVCLRREGDQAVVQVQDNGQGIPPEFLPHVFEPFRQGEEPLIREHRGLGLGLAIVKRIVELHGGTVAAASAGPGLGAAFTVRLPAAALPPEGQAAPAPPAAPDAHSLGGLDVLLVEDDPDTRRLLEQLLARYGARVASAADAEAALASLERSVPDLLLCDIALPREDGCALIREVRRRGGKLGSMPAAALTALAREEDRARALAAGFQAYLTKPIEPLRILEALRALAGRR
ncbi:MAG: PAS domain S-box protein [Elusimicrobia bacterium]|nr:PAS domain S-box protein [Elusimicrobiota bacterium]